MANTKSKKKTNNKDEEKKTKKTTTKKTDTKKTKEVKIDKAKDIEDIYEKMDKEEEVVIETIKDDEFFDKNTLKQNNKEKHIITNIVIILTLLSSFLYFFTNIIDSNSTINSLISSSILVLFSIIYLVVCLTTKRKKKTVIVISSLLLFAFFIYNTNGLLNLFSSPISTVEDFRGKSLTEVAKWANSNKVTIIQDYEYSDMVDEYSIISQDIKPGSSLKDVESITVSVSEGPNPSKEIVVPSMITWDDERVINYVNSNYLNNVNVEFIESDKKKDTVIEQDKSGNLKRDELLNLTFSYGDEGNSDEVKLIDLTNKSKFEIEFYMKQNHLKYILEYDFSSKIKKGYGISQSVKAGEIVNINDKEITITISKGPEIKIPDLKNMSITKLTEWAVKNKVKLEFVDKYDDSIKEGNVVECDKNKGDVVEQGSTIKVTISRGKLKMPGFKNIDEFYEWADKYEIKYEIKREFSDTVKAGEVISYSVKKGQAIKNDEVITVTVSDGKNCKVPDLKGLTKSEAISKLKKANLEYNFVYKNSDKAKDKVINQSISSGSEISCGATVTVTLSNGKKEEAKPNNNNNSNNNTNNSNNSSNQNNSSNNSGSSNTPTTPEKTCNSCTIYKSQISSATSGYDGNCSAAAANVKSTLQASCPGLVVNVSCQDADGFNTNDFVSGFRGGKTDSCSTISIVLAK